MLGGCDRVEGYNVRPHGGPHFHFVRPRGCRDRGRASVRFGSSWRQGLAGPKELGTWRALARRNSPCHSKWRSLCRLLLPCVFSPRSVTYARGAYTRNRRTSPAPYSSNVVHTDSAR